MCCEVVSRCECQAVCRVFSLITVINCCYFPEYDINCMYCVERGIIETSRSTLFRRRVSNSCGKFGCVCSVWGCVPLKV